MKFVLGEVVKFVRRDSEKITHTNLVKIVKVDPKSYVIEFSDKTGYEPRGFRKRVNLSSRNLLKL